MFWTVRRNAESVFSQYVMHPSIHISNDGSSSSVCTIAAVAYKALRLMCSGQSSDVCSDTFFPICASLSLFFFLHFSIPGGWKKLINYKWSHMSRTIWSWPVSLATWLWIFGSRHHCINNAWNRLPMFAVLEKCFLRFYPIGFLRAWPEQQQLRMYPKPSLFQHYCQFSFLNCNILVYYLNLRDSLPFECFPLFYLVPSSRNESPTYRVVCTMLNLHKFNNSSSAPYAQKVQVWYDRQCKYGSF